MPFVSFAPQLVIENSTSVSNVFFDEHLPVLDAHVLRVYLYGLYLCGANTYGSYDNTLEHFAKILKIPEEDVIGCFKVLGERGLVQVMSLKPIEIKYLSPKKGDTSLKKFNTDKYADFNIQIQAILGGRMITPNEFNEYRVFLDTFHYDPNALLMVAKYCAEIQGDNVGYKYILTVARNWEKSNIKTTEAVEAKLLEQEFEKTNVATIFKKLGVKKRAEGDDFTMLEKWRAMGYAMPEIENIAGLCKKMGRKSFLDIDILITQYYETWTKKWGFTNDIIDLAVVQAVGKSSPISYLDKILATWFDKKVKSVDDAKRTTVAYPTMSITRHSYGDELNKVSKKISEVKF